MSRRYVTLFCLAVPLAASLLLCGCSKPVETKSETGTAFPDPQARNHAAPGSAAPAPSGQK